MSVIHAPQKREVDLREIVPLILVGVALLVMFVRLWYLQVVQADELADKARALRTNSVSRIAPRGLIFDRNGTMVAGIKPEIVVTAVPGKVNRNKWVIDKLSEMLATPADKLWDKIEQSNWRPHLPTPIFVGVPIEVAARIVENSDSLPGIGVESQPMRYYPDTVSLCHLLGYVWTPSDRDVEYLKTLSIKPADYVGKNGLERIYEGDLMGTPGEETLEFDAKRRPLRVIGRDAPVPGNRLVLGIDLKLQQKAEKLLEGHKGAAVAIDPTNGEVLCLVSTPGFDASVFQRGISTENWDALQNDEGHPLINRAIGSRYSPGSTFKIVVAIAAMRAGVFSMTRPEFCPGYIQVGNARPKCLGVHGSITFHNAFMRSCNTYFANLARRVGPDILRETAEMLGIGRKTGIDLPSENRGLVPTDEWLASRKPPRQWFPGNTVNLGIGQGEIAATPLQMACVAALVANEGVSYKPHIVRSRQKPGAESVVERVPPEILAKIDAPATFWRELKSAMTAVIESGTARGAAKIPGLVWGGKTGSAEHRKRELTHSWFVGVAPLDSTPKISVCVLVEAAGHGNTVAAPIAREIVKAYLRPETPPPAGAIARGPVNSAASPQG